ncbi:MAG: LuxR C-terminal-related transcriptional regulator [Verrucomicrobiales bacterium]|nr:LuxR C-terminal-related transcriptional regulator [Verrucomicrobiales bacterium]
MIKSKGGCYRPDGGIESSLLLRFSLGARREGGEHSEHSCSALNARLDRHNEKEQAAMAKVELKPNFESAKPLESPGLTPREAEVLLWIAQGKSNADIATILGCAENTVKVHAARIFEQLGFENRNAATVHALEVLSKPTPRSRG